MSSLQTWFTTATMAILVSAAPMAMAVEISPSVSYLEKATPALTKAFAQDSSVDLLVYFKSKAELQPARLITNRIARARWIYRSLADHARNSQKAVLAKLATKNLRVQSFYLENAILVRNGDAQVANELAAMDEVSSLQVDVMASLKLPASQYGTNFEQLIQRPGSDYQTNIEAVEAQRVWNELNVRGKGIVVAGQDTGYMWEHESLRSKYRGVANSGTAKETVNHNYNWHDAIHAGTRVANVQASSASLAQCGPDAVAPCDDHSHGTHTMGTMVGDDGKGNQIGMAPEAQWIGCRNMNKGSGTASTYLECFEFFMAPYPLGGNPQTDGDVTKAPHVINNSWACPVSEGCTGNEFFEAVKAMKAAGIMFVAAAGNEGPGCSTVMDPPGNYSGELISVAAYNTYREETAYFSSRGPSTFNGGIGIDITAPGDGVRSATHQSGGSSYDYKSGTSMAAPHIAGIVALMWSAHPELIGEIDATSRILGMTATPKTDRQSCGDFPGNQIPNAVLGHGLVNAYRAVLQSN